MFTDGEESTMKKTNGEYSNKRRGGKRKKKIRENRHKEEDRLQWNGSWKWNRRQDTPQTNSDIISLLQPEPWNPYAACNQGLFKEFPNTSSLCLGASPEASPGSTGDSRLGFHYRILPDAPLVLELLRPHGLRPSRPAFPPLERPSLRRWRGGRRGRDGGGSAGRGGGGDAALGGPRGRGGLRLHVTLVLRGKGQGNEDHWALVLATGLMGWVRTAIHVCGSEEGLKKK